MIKAFNNPIAMGLQQKDRLDMIYLIDCVENNRQCLAIKDDGGDNNGFLHLHNDTLEEDDEDVEIYNQLMKL